jgi:hypothetical protein
VTFSARPGILTRQAAQNRRNWLIQERAALSIAKS